jgi:mRNA interferase RelE/StbE
MSERNWSVELSRSAVKGLARLTSAEVSRIFNSLEALGVAENPLRFKDVRPLEGKLDGFYRLRVGENRAIFELDGKNKRIGVLAIVPRGKAYGRR